MLRGSRPPIVLALVALATLGELTLGADPAALPKVADGWSITLVAQAPRISYPTAVVVAPDGTIFLGQDPMNMPGPVNSPVDSVLAIRPDGSTRTFASKLHSVMGLEWVDGTLYVVHAPFLSSFRDTDGDGISDSRVDLVTGLGPKVPGSNGLNDHIASGVRLGMDGFLYVSVGDKGIPLARGKDGRTITLSTGGVVRVRPDGTDLEVVSSGERNPLSAMLSARDDVFTFGNDDDSHLWPNSLTHHIVGGHYGYPYEFRDAPHRALPIMAGQSGGAGAQGVCSNDANLPVRFCGNLFICDWGLQAVARYEVEPKGATFRVVRREVVVERGDLADFRPFGIAPTADGSGFYLTDWAYNGWLGAGPPTGRLFRLTYTGPDRPAPTPHRPGSDQAQQLAGLADPTLAVRLTNQRHLSQAGTTATGPLIAMLASRTETADTPRIQALWALDAIGSTPARTAIRAALAEPVASVRAEAARSAGIRRDPLAEPTLVRLLADGDPTVRREAAIALGRLATTTPATRTALYTHLGEADPTVAWSIRRAIRSHSPPDPTALTAALADPKRRDSALTLADGWYAPEVVRVLIAALDQAQAPTDPHWRVRLVAALGSLYGKVPSWSGHWFGSNPVAGPKPQPTEAWDPPSSAAVLIAIGRALRDADAGVRRQAIIAEIRVGAKATPALRSLLESPIETDPVNTLALVRHLGEQRDAGSGPALARKLSDAAQPDEVRLAALDALAQLTGPAALNARLLVLYDSQSPDALLARALPPLGRARLLPSNDLLGFLDHKSAVVRSAALESFPMGKPLAPAVVESIMLHATETEVQTAFIAAAGQYQIRAAVPRLVELAGDADGATRSAATRALAAMPDKRAVGPLATALNDRDPDLRRASLAGLTAIRAEAVPELTAMAGRGAFIGPGAAAVERLLATFRPVTTWQVIGPFPRATGPIFADPRAIDLARTTPGLDSKLLAWQPRAADLKTGLLGLDHLASAAPDPETHPLTAFALAEITSDHNRPALLIIDTTGPTLVTVGDRPLANFPTGAQSETVRVDLKSGTNRVLLRTRQGSAPWRVQVAVSEPSATGSLLGNGQTAAVLRPGLQAFALKHGGDSKRGSALFAEAGGVGCARCHTVGDQPGSYPGLGPNLSGLALKYDKAEIIRSVLEPSSRLAVGFNPVVVARTDGTTVAGLLLGEDLAAIRLVLPAGQTITIPRSTVSERTTGGVSIMPEGLVDGISPVDFADLIAYLMSLKETTVPPK